MKDASKFLKLVRKVVVLRDKHKFKENQQYRICELLSDYNFHTYREIYDYLRCILCDDGSPIIRTEFDEHNIIVQINKIQKKFNDYFLVGDGAGSNQQVKILQFNKRQKQGQGENGCQLLWDKKVMPKPISVAKEEIGSKRGPEINDKAFWEAKFKEYLQKLVEDERFSRWAGKDKYIEQQTLTPDKSEKKKDLFDYVERTKEFRKRELKGEGISPESFGYISGKILDFLGKAENKKALIVGEPGIGKTSAVEKYFYDVAIEELRKSSPQIIPIFLESIFARNKSSFFDFIIEGLENTISDFRSLSEDNLDDFIENGRILLILDGFNEITSNDLREDIECWINRGNHKKLKCFITTRKFLHPKFLNDFERFELQYFDKNRDIRKFLEVHYPKKAAGALKQIEKQNLLGLASVPFYLNAIGKIYQPNEELPPTKGKLLERLVEIEYLKKREQKDVALDDNDIAEILPIIAFKINRNRSINWEISFDQDRYNAIINELPAERKPGKDFKNKTMRTGLLHNVHKESFFTHQILSEYFAALELKRRLLENEEGLRDEKFQKGYLNYLKWTEPISLMMGLIDDLNHESRIVVIAMEVDLLLAAKLSGCVKEEHQDNTLSALLRKKLDKYSTIEILKENQTKYAANRLTNMFNTEDKLLKHLIVDAMLYIDYESVVSDIVGIIIDKDESRIERKLAIRKVGEIGDKSAVSELVVISKDKGEDSSVRNSAIYALGEIGDESAVSELVIISKDKGEDSSVRDSAINALGKVGDKSIAHELVGILKDKDEKIYVRYSAINALGKIGDKSIAHELVGILKDKDEKIYVRYAAINALGKIGDESAVSELVVISKDKGEDSSVRDSAINALGKVGDESIAHELVGILKDKDEKGYVRYSTINALGKLGDEIILEKLHSIRYINYEFIQLIKSIQRNCGYYNPHMAKE